MVTSAVVAYLWSSLRQAATALHCGLWEIIRMNSKSILSVFSSDWAKDGL
jgi:hypothetical protein